MADTDLEQLLAAAERRDRPAREVWPAAAAAIELLWWHDRFTDARALAQATLRDLAGDPGGLFDQDVPFDEALLLGTTGTGQDPAAVLAATRALVPGDSVLGKRLTWLSENLPGREPHQLVRGALIEKPARPLRRGDAELAQRDLAGLTGEERRQLWQAAHSRGHTDLAHQLLATGHYPERWPIAVWAAGHLISGGQAPEATDLLIAALPTRVRYAGWDLVPAELVLQPRFRPCLTDTLHTAVLAAVDITTVPGYTA
ncbi:hypothetical protein [Amycolatopsis anabasis]|uniref:hypothetical protein n=1 Tax=Amycolatopsis anabasis TaxID=1840409 RepID=UPI00131D97BE|nr:hypothetical protein [Amycolatopsis anabasis]